METKTCTRCGKCFPATTAYFYRNNRTKDDLFYRCKNCHKVIDKCYKDANRETIREKAKKYWHANKAHYKDYYESIKHLPRKDRSSYYKIYRGLHREEYTVHERRHRALKRSVTVADFNDQQWFASQPRPLHCYLCGKLIRKNDKLHIEHRIPLSRGGAHAPWNLGVAHATCNLSKGTKTPFEYAPDRFLPCFL